MDIQKAVHKKMLPIEIIIKLKSMKKILIIASFLCISNTGFAQYEHHEATEVITSETQKKPASPRLSAMAMIGDNHVHIDYGSPSVRGRNIWNGLVAYNQIWATGAHKATWIDFGQDVTVEGTHISKGTYGFFTIPGKKEWVLIINKTWDMHLADAYKIEDDIVRVKVKPKKNRGLVEVLTYEVLENGKNRGQIKMSWEKLSVSFDFENHK